jgi:hypothetical protein
MFCKGSSIDVTVDDDTVTTDVTFASPFQDLGLDNLVAEKIFSYLDGIDLYVCLYVSKVMLLGGIFQSAEWRGWVHC